ncbi:coiled-coil domain-containing protein [Oceanibaculum indicum]|uniref:Tape measure domain-containing protein n=1 Tax=Oceanibaculum indicum TaxID=526216 RepID=A0A420WR20_9PROT|nr:hypothetical protein [Oceanibaculum indicum]RKQ73488.1 hypothetical protein BCL74_1277 [Oceanibaculum indicum]
MLRGGLDDALIVRIAGDDDHLRRTLMRTKSEVDAATGPINRSLRTVDRELDRVRGTAERFSGALRSVGVGLSVAAFTNFARGALQAADAVGKAADRIGLGVEAYQELRYAADLAGVSAQQLEEAMAQLNRRIAEGKLPYETTEQALAAIADRLEATSDSTERAKIVNDAFGESGRRLIPLLKDGAAGLAAVRKEARDLNLVLDNETVRAAEKFNDQLSRMNQVIQTNLQAGLLKGLVSDTQALATIYESETFQKGIDGLGRAFGRLAQDAVDAVVSVGALAEMLDNPSWENAKKLFESLGIVKLGRSTGEGLGLLSRTVPGADIAGGIDDDLNRFLPSPKKVAASNDEITETAQKVIEALRQQQDQLSRTGRDQAIYNQLARAGVDINSAAGKQIAALAGNLYDQEQASKELAKATEAKQEVMRRAAEITRSVETETEAFARVQEELNALLESGYITQETFNRALQDADPAYRKAQEAAKKFSQEAERAAKDATREAQRQAEEMERLAQDADRVPPEAMNDPRIITLFQEAIA